MADPRSLTSLTLWLEEALSGWILPLLALTLVGGALGLYFLGALPEGPSAAVMAAVVAVGSALLMIRPSLAGSVDGPGRVMAGVAALGVVALASLLSISAVLPGAPVVEGDLTHAGDLLALPEGLEGPVRVLVHAPLPAGGAPRVDVRLGLGTGSGPLEGRVERTLSSARAGRSRTTVAHDRNETWLHGRVVRGTPALTLERVTGPVDGPLHVAVFHDLLPPGAAWALAVAVLLAAALAEVRLGRGNPAAFAGIGLGYGLLVGGWATPSDAVGFSIRALLLGTLAGGVAGAVAAWVARLGPWRAALQPRERPRARSGPKVA